VREHTLREPVAWPKPAGPPRSRIAYAAAHVVVDPAGATGFGGAGAPAAIDWDAIVSTLGQALAMAEPFPAAQVGVVIDAYHLWWDPRLAEDLPRAAGRIASYQVSDWILPLAADTLRSRGLPGDGHIDLASLTREVARIGYAGDVEVEVMNAEVAARPLDDVLADLVRRHRDLVLPELA
jgi:sugar phosphate isomerase/epimerase